MLGLMQVRSAVATTAVHGGLSERLFCTRKLNPQTTASSRAKTATGVQATTDRPPPGTPSGTPRGRSAAMIAVYSSSAGAMT